MEKYWLMVGWRDEDAAFVVEVPALPGCMAHGNTLEEALAHAQDAMTLWLDTARACGDPIPKPAA